MRVEFFNSLINSFHNQVFKPETSVVPSDEKDNQACQTFPQTIYHVWSHLQTKTHTPLSFQIGASGTVLCLRLKNFTYLNSPLRPVQQKNSNKRLFFYVLLIDEYQNIEEKLPSVR